MKENMHYKNKAEAKVGDVVVGITHNSKNKIRIGKVIALMPQQGPCNVKLLVFGFTPMRTPDGNDEGFRPQFWGSEFVSMVRYVDEQKHTIEIAEDYADTAELLRVQDCYRMLNAICGSGNHDAPYFDIHTEF